MLGSGIEAAYSAVGGSNEPSSFSTTGKEQHAKGEAEVSNNGAETPVLRSETDGAQVKAAEAQGYVEGAGDRVSLLHCLASRACLLFSCSIHLQDASVLTQFKVGGKVDSVVVSLRPRSISQVQSMLILSLGRRYR